MALKKTKTQQQIKVNNLAVQHQAYLQRLAAVYALDIIKIIDSSNPELISYLKKRLLRFGAAAADKATADKFAEIEKQIAKIRGDAIDEAEAFFTMETVKLGRNEADFGKGTIRLLAEKTAVEELSDKSIKNISDYGLFSGRSIQKWFTDLADADTNRIMNAVRTGVVTGRTNEQIVKTITGTPETDYVDGILNMARNDAKAVVRTAANGVSNSVRKEFYEQNSDVIKELVFVATLDNRTSLVCASLDGKRWKIPDELDDVKWPPLHPNCRSTVTPLVEGLDDLTGQRPAQDGEREDGKPNYVQVSSKTSYSEWFAQQDEDFQRDILGASRFELYKNGELTIDKFVDYGANKQFTLNELRAKDETAFEKAGLEPQEMTLPKPGATADGSIYVTEDGLNNFPSGNSFAEIKLAYDAAMKSPEDFTKLIKDAETEFSASYDSKGNLYSVGKGKETAVEMPILEGSKLVIHNHPDGMPFSVADIENVLIGKQVESMKVITGSGEFSLTRLSKGRIIDIDEFRSRFSKALKNMPKKMDVSEKLNTVLKEVFNGTGYKYRSH